MTFDTPEAVALLEDERAVWAYHPTTRNLRNAIRNLLLARRVLAAEHPDVVVSDGAVVAVPFFLLAKLPRIPTIRAPRGSRPAPGTGDW